MGKMLEVMMINKVLAKFICMQLKLWVRTQVKTSDDVQHWSTFSAMTLVGTEYSEYIFSRGNFP